MTKRYAVWFRETPTIEVWNGSFETEEEAEKYIKERDEKKSMFSINPFTWPPVEPVKPPKVDSSESK